MMRIASKRGEILQQIYAAVGDKPFRAKDVPVNTHRLSGMALDGVLVKTKEFGVSGSKGHAVTTWRISRDGLCIIRGERIDREQSRRGMYHGIKKLNGKNTR